MNKFETAHELANHISSHFGEGLVIFFSQGVVLYDKFGNYSIEEDLGKDGYSEEGTCL